MRGWHLDATPIHGEGMKIGFCVSPVKHYDLFLPVPRTRFPLENCFSPPYTYTPPIRRRRRGEAASSRRAGPRHAGSWEQKASRQVGKWCLWTRASPHRSNYTAAAHGIRATSASHKQSADCGLYNHACVRLARRRRSCRLAISSRPAAGSRVGLAN